MRDRSFQCRVNHDHSKYRQNRCRGPPPKSGNINLHDISDLRFYILENSYYHPDLTLHPSRAIDSSRLGSREFCNKVGLDCTIVCPNRQVREELEQLSKQELEELTCEEVAIRRCQDHDYVSIFKNFIRVISDEFGKRFNTQKADAAYFACRICRARELSGISKKPYRLRFRGY